MEMDLLDWMLLCVMMVTFICVLFWLVHKVWLKIWRTTKKNQMRSLTSEIDKDGVVISPADCEKLLKLQDRMTDYIKMVGLAYERLLGTQKEVTQHLAKIIVHQKPDNVTAPTGQWEERKPEEFWAKYIRPVCEEWHKPMNECKICHQQLCSFDNCPRENKDGRVMPIKEGIMNKGGRNAGPSTPRPNAPPKGQAPK